MYSFRENLDTKMIEILKDDYVEYEIPKAAFPQFALDAWAAAKTPSVRRKVRIKRIRQAWEDIIQS